MKAFIGYVKAEDLAHLLQYQRVLAIKQRRKKVATMMVPGKEGAAAILRNPDVTTSKGHRDMMLLTLLYDSGARVSELCGITIRDLRLGDPAVIILNGKGRKMRGFPLWGRR